MYGKGNKIGENYYQADYGVKLFFYNSESIEKEFGEYGLIDFIEVDELNNNPNKPSINFWIIRCRKKGYY